MTSKFGHSWIEKDLSEIIDTIESGLRPYGGVTEDSGEIPSLGGENIRQQGGLDLTVVNKVRKRFFNLLRKGILQREDVLINKDGANTGKVAIYQSEFLDACINEHLFLLRGKSDSLDQRFLYRLLQSHRAQATIRRKISGSAQPGLKSDFIRKFPVKFPSSPSEQRRIAEVLDLVDDMIAKTETVILKLRQVRTGLLNDLLSLGIDDDGKLRTPYEEASKLYKESPIGWIPRDWIVGPLGSFFTLQRGFDITQEKQEQGNIPVVSSSGITSYHSKAMCEGPGVIIGRKGKLGDAYYVEGPYWPHDTSLWVKDFHGNFPKFAWLFLGSLRLKRFDAATSVPTLNRNFIHPMLVAIPGRNEQENIVSNCEEIEENIHKEESWLNKLCLLKLGLSSHLLSGRVRVPEGII